MPNEEEIVKNGGRCGWTGFILEFFSSFRTSARGTMNPFQKGRGSVTGRKPRARFEFLLGGKCDGSGGLSGLTCEMGFRTGPVDAAPGGTPSRSQNRARRSPWVRNGDWTAKRSQARPF